jgi:hypothetical protein
MSFCEAPGSVPRIYTHIRTNQLSFTYVYARVCLLETVFFWCVTLANHGVMCHVVLCVVMTSCGAWLLARYHPDICKLDKDVCAEEFQKVTKAQQLLDDRASSRAQVRATFAPKSSFRLP